MDFADLSRESCHSLGKLFSLQMIKSPFKKKKISKLPMEYSWKMSFQLKENISF